MYMTRPVRPTTARLSAEAVQPEVPSSSSAAESSETLLEQQQQKRGPQSQQPQCEESESAAGSTAGPTEGEEDGAWDDSPQSEHGGRYGSPATQFHTMTPRMHSKGGSGFVTRRAVAEARRRGTVALLSTAAQTARVLRQSQVQPLPPLFALIRVSACIVPIHAPGCILHAWSTDESCSVVSGTRVLRECSSGEEDG